MTGSEVAGDVESPETSATAAVCDARETAQSRRTATSRFIGETPSVGADRGKRPVREANPVPEAPAPTPASPEGVVEEPLSARIRTTRLTGEASATLTFRICGPDEPPPERGRDRARPRGTVHKVFRRHGSTRFPAATCSDYCPHREDRG